MSMELRWNRCDGRGTRSHKRPCRSHCSPGGEKTRLYQRSGVPCPLAQKLALSAHMHSSMRVLEQNFWEAVLPFRIIIGFSLMFPMLQRKVQLPRWHTCLRRQLVHLQCRKYGLQQPEENFCLKEVKHCVDFIVEPALLEIGLRVVSVFTRNDQI